MAPTVTPGADIEAARAYYESLIASHPSVAAKLEKSLDWQIGQYEPTIQHFAGRGKSLIEAAGIWLSRARMAADAKCK
jgi:hypothetical protein